MPRQYRGLAKIIDVRVATRLSSAIIVGHRSKPPNTVTPPFAQVDIRDAIHRGSAYAWAQARVRPSPVVMRHPFLDDRTDVSFTQHDHPIQALATHRADQALAERVRLRASHRRLQHREAHRRHRVVNGGGIDAVAVVNRNRWGDRRARSRGTAGSSTPPSDAPSRSNGGSGGRVPTSSTTNTYTVWNVAVTATKKSHARTAPAWLRTKVLHRETTHRQEPWAKGEPKRRRQGIRSRTSYPGGKRNGRSYSHDSFPMNDSGGEYPEDAFRTPSVPRAASLDVGPNRPAIASRAAAMFSENARGARRCPP